MEAIFEAAAEANDSAMVDDGAPNLHKTKEKMSWVSGVLSCFTTALKLFGKADLLDDFYEDSFYIKPERIIESKCIGEGAQGKVHLATLNSKRAGGRIVAIKYVQQIDDMTVRHLRNIKHVNIVQTMGVCINPPKYYIIMEYCENGSLFDYMRQGIKYSPIQMINWARDIASGMRHLHDKNIIHRDLKSPNILITANLTAKISDFGTSRTIDGHSKLMSFVGTLNWMAPEVIRGEKYSNKVDVWSFGVVVWELVTLQIPYYKMEQHAIMWGVGTDGVSLPIPQGIPTSIHVLLVQCRNRRHALRPSFAMIIRSLDMIAEELMLYDQRTFSERQNVWARETRVSLEMAFLRSQEECRKRIPAYTQLDLYNRRDLKDQKHALDLRMDATNDMFFEICSVRLALETRERELAQKEKMVEDCSCGVRKILNLQREISSSSEASGDAKKPESKLMVSMIHDKIVTSAINELCQCEDTVNGEKIRSDNVECKKDTVVVINGNVDLKARAKRAFAMKKARKAINVAEV